MGESALNHDPLSNPKEQDGRQAIFAFIFYPVHNDQDHLSKLTQGIIPWVNIK